MQDKKNTHGGKRAGSGRKTDEPTVPCSPRIKISTYQWLLDIAGEGYVSQSINIVLRHAMDTDKGKETISLADRLEMIKALKK